MTSFSDQVNSAFHQSNNLGEPQKCRDYLIAENVTYIADIVRKSVLYYAGEHGQHDDHFVYRGYIVYRPDLHMESTRKDTCEPTFIVEEKSSQANLLGLETQRISTVITDDGQALAERLSEALAPDGFQVSPWCMLLLSWSSEHETVLSKGPFSLLEKNNDRQEVTLVKGPYYLKGEAQQVFKPTFKKQYAQSAGLYSSSGTRIFQNQLIIDHTTVDDWKGPRTRFIPALSIRYEV